MSAGDLALLLAATLCALGFTALVVVLSRVLATLRALRDEVELLRQRTTPLIDDLRESTDSARDAMREAQRDLQRFDRVLGSAEAISGAMTGSGRLARQALSTPVIKTAAVATGIRRIVQRLRPRRVRSSRADLHLVESPSRKRA